MLGTCTTSASSAPPLTVEGLRKLIADLEALMPPVDGLAALMRERGFDPDRGCVLFLPESMRSLAGPFPPKYVRFSAFIPAPIMVDAKKLGLPEVR